MALKDNAGLVKKYAMIDIQRYQNVAVGDTPPEETEKSYKKLLRANGVSTDDDSGKATKTDGTATGTYFAGFRLWFLTVILITMSCSMETARSMTVL